MRPCMRWGLSAAAVMGIGLALGSLAATPCRGAEKLNVLMIAVDDLRPELGCYGVSQIRSPQIDKLAARGVVFQRAYCQQAVCSPSRTSLLTGARPDTTQVYDLETHFRNKIPNVVTLPQHFKNHGYFTAGMGKIYHGGLDDRASWTEPHWTPKKAVTYSDPANRVPAGSPKTVRGAPWEKASGDDGDFHDGFVANYAIETLGRVKDQPFFLAVGFIRPHLPFVAPAKYWDLYPADSILPAPLAARPKDAPAFALSNFGELRAYQNMPKTGPVTEADAKMLRHGYYASVSYMDAQVGRVLAELERLGLAEKTIVVLWGDHGWKLGEYGEWCKHTNFELDARVPLIVSAPGMAQGKSARALTEFVDIYPSLCDLADLPLPEHLEGSSFAPVLADPTIVGKPAAFGQYPRKNLMGYTMRTDRYRYTRWVERKQPEKIVAVELYDHETDPGETTNIAGVDAQAEVLAALAQQFDAGWQAVNPRPTSSTPKE